MTDPDKPRGGRFRIATWNICWFAGLFDDRDQLLLDDSRSAIYEVDKTRQANAIAEVMRRVDADLIAVIEAPNTGKTQSTTRALQRFAGAFGLRQTDALIGFASDTEQEIALMFDPSRIKAEHAPVGQVLTEETAPHADPDPAPRFDGVYPLDLDGDGDMDLHRFSKPPLEAEVDFAGRTIRMIAVHAK